MPRIFEDAEIRQFIDDGYVILRGAFSQEAYQDGPFAEIINDRIRTAVDELAGPVRN